MSYARAEERELATPMHDLVDNAECPGCGARSTLDPEHVYPGARSCGACSGWFLERDAAYRFLVEELATSSDHIARLLAAPGARKRRCPACDKDMSAIVILGEEVDLCAGCGGAWLAPGGMMSLSRGRYGAPSTRQSTPPGTLTGPPSAPPSPFGLPTGERPASPFGPPAGTAPFAAATTEMPRAITFPSADAAPLGPAEMSRGPGAPAVAALAAAPSDELELARPLQHPSAAVDDEVTEPRRRRAKRPKSAAPVMKIGKSVPSAGGAAARFEGASLGSVAAAARWRGKLPWLAGGAAVVVVALVVAFAVAGEEEAPVSPAAEANSAQKYAAYLRHYRFGGRHLDWWSERLSALAPGGATPDAKTFLITKDRAQRLGLVVTEQPGRVQVTLSEPLSARLLDRLEVE